MKNYKKVLYVIDTVKGFIDQGPMHDKEIRRIIPAQVKLIKEFLKEEHAVVFICEGHDKDSIEFDFYPEHCLKGTVEAELVEELKQFENQKNVYKIYKDSTCGFASPEYAALASQFENVEEEVYTGCCTDICVLNMIIPRVMQLIQMRKRVKTTMPMDAVETYEAPWHNRDLYTFATLLLLKQAGVNIVDTYNGSEYSIDENYQYSIKRR